MAMDKGRVLLSLNAFHPQRWFELLSVERTVVSEPDGPADPTITYRWLRDGTVPAMKLGKRWIILRDDVKQHLRASYNTPSTTDD